MSVAELAPVQVSAPRLRVVPDIDEAMEPRVTRLRVVPTAPSPARVASGPGRGTAVPARVRSVEKPLAVRREYAVTGDSVERGLKIAVMSAVVVLALAVLIVVGLAVGSFFFSMPADSFTVQTGDTLWSIASSLPGAPSVDAAVADLRDLNGLTTDFLQSGQILHLPSY